MPNNKKTKREDSTQPQTEDTANGNENAPVESAPKPPEKLQEVDLGSFVVGQTDEPDIDDNPQPPQASEPEPIPQNDGQPVETTATEAKPVTDKAGNVFDPAIHCVDEFGQPRLTKTGLFRKRKGAGNAETVKVNPINRFNLPPDPSTLHVMGMMIDTVTLLASKTLGEDWAATKDERDMLADVYSRYAAYKGWADSVNPETAVIGATVMYLLPRVMNPKFMEKMKTLFGKKQNAHTDNRENADGENAIRQDNNDSSGKSGDAIASDRPNPVAGLGQFRRTN